MLHETPLRPLRGKVIAADGTPRLYYEGAKTGRDIGEVKSGTKQTYKHIQNRMFQYYARAQE